MHPVIFKIGSFELSSYGLALAISVLMGIFVARKRAPRFGVNPDLVLDLTLVIMIAAIVGSRLWYVIQHPLEFKGNFWGIVNPVHDGYIGIAGLSMVGGVVLAIISAFVFSKAKKLNFINLGDVLAPVFLLGAGFQRLFGCFMNGCCFGSPTDSFLGIVFPSGAVASSVYPGISIWPTQLFASFLGFAGFALILWAERKHSFSGYTLWLVFAYYALDRFTVDQFRYYEPQEILAKISVLTINMNHVLLAGLFIICAVLWYLGWSKQRQKKAETTSA